jgi:hypothetical protein
MYDEWWNTYPSSAGSMPVSLTTGKRGYVCAESRRQCTSVLHRNHYYYIAVTGCLVTRMCVFRGHLVLLSRCKCVLQPSCPVEAGMLSRTRNVARSVMSAMLRFKNCTGRLGPTVHLCQASWCDPAVRSHVGSLGGALAYSTCLDGAAAACSVSSWWTGSRAGVLGDLQRWINILGLREGARGREDCFLRSILRQ